MKLKDYIDPDRLAQYISEGLVSVKAHPVLPLNIYCYTRRATFDNIWDDVTGRTRGLIVDTNTDEIIARPFEKFFNFDTEDKPETWLNNIPKTEPVWLDKLDGSLGILWTYEHNGKLYSGIASKGSFTSDYAFWATTWYDNNVISPSWPKGYTPIFEMICQSIQTHVVLYDIPDQLILTALVSIETGEEMDYAALAYYANLNGLKVVDHYNFHSYPNAVLDVAYTHDRQNREGYVASWPRPGQPPLKIKFKHPTFLKLQKIVHAATPKKILEALINKDYELLQAWEDGLSPELARYVREWKDKFTDSYGHILVESRNALGFLCFNFETRKEQAAEILASPKWSKLSGVIFTMLDGQIKLERNLANVSRAAWKLVAEGFQNELDQVREE